jgi:hypothetical protein
VEVALVTEGAALATGLEVNSHSLGDITRLGNVDDIGSTVVDGVVIVRSGGTSHHEGHGEHGDEDGASELHFESVAGQVKTR